MEQKATRRLHVVVHADHMPPSSMHHLCISHARTALSSVASAWRLRPRRSSGLPRTSCSPPKSPQELAGFFFFLFFFFFCFFWMLRLCLLACSCWSRRMCRKAQLPEDLAKKGRIAKRVCPKNIAEARPDLGMELSWSSQHAARRNYKRCSSRLRCSLCHGQPPPLSRRSCTVEDLKLSVWSKMARLGSVIRFSASCSLPYVSCGAAAAYCAERSSGESPVGAL